MWANGGREGAEAEEGQVDAVPLEKKQSAAYFRRHGNVPCDSTCTPTPPA